METIDINDFTEVARDHATHPRHYGPLENFNGHSRITGPCGDTMDFWIDIKNKNMNGVSFSTDGCQSALACGSMVACMALDLDIEKVLTIDQKNVLKTLGGMPKDSEHCALLAVNTLKAACNDYLQQQKKTHELKQISKSNERPAKQCHETTEMESENQRKLTSRLARIKHKIVVLSGKGGVGKSTIAVNLAKGLAADGHHVGVLDIDIHGPSIPTMLGVEGIRLQGCETGLLPIEVDGMKVISLGFLLEKKEDAVIWRGPRKMGVIKQFLTEVLWGDLDYLIVDSPPGTGDEPLSICQLIEDIDGAVIVTTPQNIATIDVRKSITFCQQLHVPIVGVVENMSGFECPTCGTITNILRSGGGRQIAEDMHVPFLGSIPLSPVIAEECDSGRTIVDRDKSCALTVLIHNIVQAIMELGR